LIISYEEKAVMNKVPSGTVVDGTDLGVMERLIFGDNITMAQDKYEFFARKAFLDTVLTLMRKGDRQLVKL
jgi:hypothetical protein